ncbi:hypothetical protein MLD38_012621 [Melastoma candidum]|uniref:Uncharacterized protein n=1 Tax=Melastoma candidum TaxID=119954 RepID=A0ACB9R6X6_9MYRT|nr:hypothetical protein MLD38_012621 [Melastoma candidum]
MEKGNKHGYGIPPAKKDDEPEGCIPTAETLLRLLPMALCVSALVIMLKDSQANDYGSISYSHLGAFRYLVHANGICAGYSLLSAIIMTVPGRLTMPRAWTFFFLDQVLTYALLAAGAASIEVLFLAYHGDRAITWSAACGSFDSSADSTRPLPAPTEDITCYMATN